MTAYLDEAAVARLLRYEDLIPAMAGALRDFSAGAVQQPVRQFLAIPEHSGFFGVMPAVGEAMGAMGVKLVTAYPDNAGLGLPTHLAIIILFRPETGEQVAVMDGRLITEMRTAAVSAVATGLLAPPGARVLAVLGSGVQARSHVEALRLDAAFEEIRVWSRTPANAERLAAGIGARAMSAEAAVKDADVVVVATASTKPVLRGAWLKPGAHVNAVGWRGHDSRELDDAAMKGVVIVESRAAAADQCGDVRGSGAPIHAELGEVLAGRRPARADETTIFESVGMAIEDVVAAKLVHDLWTADQASSG